MPKKIIFFFTIIILGLGGLAIYQKLTLDDGRLHVVFCDVGQGDAILIRTPRGQDILVDGGPDSRVLNCLGKHLPFWDRTIELMILTHPQADHLNGLLDVIDRYSLIQFMESSVVAGDSPSQGYQQLKKKLEGKKVKVIKTAAGDRIKTGEGLALTTLWPPAEFSASDPNDLSVVLLLDFSSLDVLLTGDANIQTGFYNNVGQEIDILKVAHHGSRTGTDEEFLDKVRPRLAVISVGKNNSYGHPHQEVIKILRDKQSLRSGELKDIKILRTDEKGEVEIITDGEKWRVSPAF